MKRFYRFAATVVAAFAAVAAIGAGALLVATSMVIGALLIAAGRLALGGREQGPEPEGFSVDTPQATEPAPA